MRKFALVITSCLFAALAVAPAFAHGDEPHPKCKKGYVLTDEHRCVKQ